jgi:hypothetical protein
VLRACPLPLPPAPCPCRRLSILQDTQAKVLARGTQLHQLDLLLQELAPLVPPSACLPDLARPLGEARTAAAAPAAAPAAGAAAGAKAPPALK